MKLKFVDQQYQTDAVNSICDIFDGAVMKDSVFTIDYSSGIEDGIGVEGEGVSYFLGHSNKKNAISDQRMLENVQSIQDKNDIEMSNTLDNKMFNIEMETGTGKTYVYTKTILELNKRYGFTKFIIVVPSIAIKEGVFKSLQTTREHFMERYDNVVYNYFVYDSAHLERVRDFATSTNIEIMIINIDAFRKSFDDPRDLKKKANIIHRESEKLSGNKPIDLIASTNPIVIIDEPQSVDGTKKSKDAIQSLNPLCQLRYSATHKESHDLMYRLTPVDAYHQHLVKQIEVASITSNEASAKPYVKLLSVSNKNDRFTCRLEIYVKNKKTGVIDKKAVTAKYGDDLWELSNEVDYYEDEGYFVDNIDVFKGEENVSFANGELIHIGEAINEVDDVAMKRAQIKQTIQLHLDKEMHLIPRGIKVLSLFFIDEVSKYRDYDREDEKGDYARWFEEEYNKLIMMKKYSKLRDTYGDYVSLDASIVHDGYFARDGKGRLKNSTKAASGTAEESTFQLIMKDKERLLDLNEPIRFIFSHSALKEGWDNPNIMQVCTLVETKDILTKRQKIGRGLRICVNQDGERVLDPKCNTLSVIANESYKEFATSLQKELETDNFKFGVIEQLSFKNLIIHDYDGSKHILTESDSKEIYAHLVANEYITKNGKPTTKYYQDKHDGTFNVPAKFEAALPKIEKRIERLSLDIEIKDAFEKVPVKINKEVELSPEFQSLWNKIKQKTVYTVNMDLDKLMREAIEGVKNMPKIKADRIDVEFNTLTISNQGISGKNKNPKQLGKVNEFEVVHNYPDFIRRLQESTQLLRKTIVEIIAKSGRLSDFYENPEEFIKQVSQILLNVKKENLTEGIKYEKTDEYYEQSLIFDDEGMYGYKDRNVLELDANKNIYDHVVYDSEIEKQFAIDAEADDDVLVYAKLPSRFKIDTPVGSYNPDWALVLNTDEGEKLYFVAETKGTDNIDDTRGSERKKIFCGRKHFEVLDSNIKYEVVKELRGLK